MAYRFSTPAKGAATIVLAAGFVAGGMSAANSAAPTLAFRTPNVRVSRTITAEPATSSSIRKTTRAVL